LGFVSASTPVGSCAAGEVWTWSFYAKGSLTDSCPCYLQARDAGGGWVDNPTAFNITPEQLTSNWTRFSASTAALPANSSRFGIVLQPAFFHEGDVFDLTIDDMQLEKSAVLTPYFDGGYPSCAWTGTANASTSTRTASALVYQRAYGAEHTIACRSIPVGNYEGGVLVALYDITNGNESCDVRGADAQFLNYERWTDASYDAILGATQSGAGASNSLVQRVGASQEMDLTVNGTPVTQVTTGAGKTSRTQTGVCLGTNPAGSGPTDAYIGPVAICPSRITDAQAAVVDAGLTAGWSGLDLFRFFQSRGYANTLILPLAGDSVGYVVNP
jgi:hypothetical protein